MQVSRIVQAVVLMLIVALAASCAASKEYSSKLFKARTETEKNSQAAAVRFLELDKLNVEKENWVTTDIIMGRDTGSATIALDNLAKTFPARQVTSDTVSITKEEKTVIVSLEKKPLRIPEEKKNPEVVNLPVAKNDNTGVRNKRTRAEKHP